MYRLLLYCFPRAFRRRFGEDRAAVFEDRRRAAARRGKVDLARLWSRTVVDGVRHGLAERRLENTRRQGRGALERSMQTIWQDLRNAFRSLARQPLFAVLAAGMLAVGLFFNITLFAVVDAAILRPLPFRNADELLLLWSGRNPDGSAAVNSPADFQDWKARATSFSGMAAYNISLATISGEQDPEELHGSVVTREFFDILGSRPLLGRTFLDDDYLTGSDATVLISESLWRRRFGANPDFVGSLITMSDRPRRVVGVMPDTLMHPEPFWYRDADYWFPFRITDQMLVNRSGRYVRVIARLADGVSLEDARTEMDVIGRQLMNEHPETNTTSVIVVPLTEQLVGDTRPLFWLFLGASGLVLFLAGTNIVNLMLARTSRRRFELAVRSALGAGQWRLGRQLAFEGALVGLLAGAFGLSLATIGIPLVVTRAPVALPGLVDAGLNGRVLLVSVTLSILAGVACGLLPAFRVVRSRLSGVLGSARGASSDLEATRGRTWLVIAEIALATPLVVGALLLAQTLGNLQRVDPGFDPAGTLSFRVTLSGDRYDDGQASVRFFDDLEDRLRALPGVTASGIVSSLPMGGLNNTAGAISAPGETPDVVNEVRGGFRMASSGYFEAMGIDIVRGTTFADGIDGSATVVVNEALASALWGDADPIGRQVRLGGADADGDWSTVVGVARDVRHVRLTQPPDPEVFLPYVTNPWSTMSVVLRGSGAPGGYEPQVRSIVRQLDGRLAVVNVLPVADIVAGGWARARFGTICAVLFAGIGFLLAAGGTFAVLSLLVAARRREIGIRLALGASPQRVGRLIVRQAMVPTAIGCALGAGAAIAAANLLSASLFGVAPRDPLAMVGAVASLAVAALLASWLPARRAMRVDPLTTLKGDL